MPSASHSPSKPWIAPVTLVGAVLLVYWPVVTFGFLNWDDPHTVTSNPHLNPPTAAGLGWHWMHYDFGLFIPVTYSAWWATAQLTSAQAAWAFHALNVIVHALTSLVVLLLLRRLTTSGPAAFVGAMLFALHPLQSEAVAWVSGLKDVLCGLLAAISLWQYVTYAQNPAADRRAWSWAMLAFILALLAKPVAVVVPFLAITIDILILHRPGKIALRSAAPMVVVAVLWTVVAAWVQDTGMVTTTVPWWQRPFVAVDALSFYLIKLIAPLRLAPDYGRTPQAQMESARIWVSWILPVAITLVLLTLRRRRPGLAAAGLIFLLGLLPVLGLVTFQFQEISTVADHYMYLPMIGVALAVATLLENARARAVGVVCTVALTSLGILSIIQTMYWRDSRTLFTHALEVNPQSSVASNNLAFVMLDRDPAEAERLARRAVEVKPNNEPARVNLGMALAKQARPEDAAEQFKKAIALEPNDADAHSNLAAAYGEMGRFDDARRECDVALQINPNHRQARLILSLLQRVPKPPSASAPAPVEGPAPATTRSSG
ncbi:MAG TPA: tetratricopeptide repeat protein [Tepidisphaeraceae bacterium]|jgi:hypothetical protein